MGEKINLKDIKDKKRKEDKSSLVNIIIFAVLFVMIATLSLATYLKITNADILNEFTFLEKYVSSIIKNTEEHIYKELDFDLSDKPKVSVYNGNIAMCSKESLRIYNSNGELKNTIELDFKTPIVKSSENYLVVSNMYGRKVIFFEGYKKKWEKEQDGNIINVDINKDGYVAVVHKGKNILSEVTIYNRSGVECFAKGKATNYIVDAKLSNNSNEIVLNCIDTSGIKLNSIFEFIDINGKSTQKVFSHEDKLFLDTKFVKDNKFVALTGNEVICYDSEHNEKWTKNLNNKVYCFNVCDNKYIVLDMANNQIKDNLYGDKTEIKILNMKGNEVKTIKIDNIVKNISVYDDVMALNLGKEVMLYTAKGKYLKTLTSKMEVDKVEFINKGTVVFLTKNNLIIKN